MAKKAKALVRKITRKQALSYDRTVPNRRGVTALAELNGKGAYEERYSETLKILGKDLKQVSEKKMESNKKKYVMTPARKRAFKKMLAARKSSLESKYNSNVAEMYAGRESDEIGFDFSESESVVDKPKRSRKSAKMTKSEFIAAKEAKPLSKKQIEHQWKMYKYGGAKGIKAHKEAVKKAATKRAKTPKKYGPFTAIKAKIGPVTKDTFLYKGKKGKVRHIPEYALLGFQSAREMKSVFDGPDSMKKSRAAAKSKRIESIRDRSAKRASARILAGQDIFSPNENLEPKAGARVISFEEWKKMEENKKSKSRKPAKKSGKAVKKSAAKSRSKAKKGTKESFIRKVMKKGRTRKQAEGLWKGQAALKKYRAEKKTTKKSARKGAAKKTVAKKTVAKKVVRRRRSSKKAKVLNVNLPRAKKNIKVSVYNENRRRRRGRKSKYLSNVSGAMFMGELKQALKLGAVVTAGYVAHRALTKLVDDQLVKLDFVKNNETLSKYSKIISSLLVGLVGVPLTVRLAPAKFAAAAGAGMAASFLHGAVMKGLEAAGNETATKVAGYLSAYPEDSAKAYGSYYTTYPGQVLGEFYQTSGFGAPVLEAAAGYGAPVLEAAAGYGAPVLEAAAGYGAPVLEAAAGTGEYMAYNVSGYGEYEQVPMSGSNAAVDEGIYPDLDSAEVALNVMDGAAGFGNDGIPMVNTVNPSMMTNAVADEPGGSRSGLFSGGDGIFG